VLLGQGIHTNHTLFLVAAEMTIRAKFIDDEMLTYQKELASANILPGKTASSAVNTRFSRRLTR
jgi:hypothetical protein